MKRGTLKTLCLGTALVIFGPELFSTGYTVGADLRVCPGLILHLIFAQIGLQIMTGKGGFSRCSQWMALIESNFLNISGLIERDTTWNL